MIYQKIIWEMGAPKIRGIRAQREFLESQPVTALALALRSAVEKSPRTFMVWYHVYRIMKPNRALLARDGTRRPACLITQLGGAMAYGALNGWPDPESG